LKNVVTLFEAKFEVLSEMSVKIAVLRDVDSAGEPNASVFKAKDGNSRIF
jgi:hypothetical protein